MVEKLNVVKWKWFDSIFGGPEWLLIEANLRGQE